VVSVIKGAQPLRVTPTTLLVIGTPIMVTSMTEPGGHL
jgi:hypothetical protein